MSCDLRQWQKVPRPVVDQYDVCAPTPSKRAISARRGSISPLLLGSRPQQGLHQSRPLSRRRRDSGKRERLGFNLVVLAPF